MERGSLMPSKTVGIIAKYRTSVYFIPVTYAVVGFTSSPTHGSLEIA